MEVIELLVNKQNTLGKDYVPEDLVDITSFVHKDCKYTESEKPIQLRKCAINAFKIMKKDASEVGIDFYVDSAYRSYDYQNDLLKRCIAERGDKAYEYCALPGTSEHQTGLAIDLGFVDENNVYNMEIKENTLEYEWLLKNSYKYGFILRYPNGKEKITGYMFEPWHYRFVGKELAKKLFEQNVTLDEYYKKP